MQKPRHKTANPTGAICQTSTAVEAAADISMVAQNSDHPMVLYPRLALLLGGSNEALFVTQLDYWIKKSGHTREDGQCWVWNSVKDWVKQFVWLTPRSLDCVIRKLEKLNVVVSDKPRQQRWDQTKWYRLNYEKLAEMGWNPHGYAFHQNVKSSSPKREIEFTKAGNRVHQSGKSSLLTETTIRDYDSEITLSLPTPPQEKERVSEEKYLKQEEEGNQGDGKPEGTSAPQSSASLKDKPEVNAKPKDSKLDQPSAVARVYYKKIRAYYANGK